MKLEPGQKISKITIVERTFSTIYVNVIRGKVKYTYRQNWKYVCDCGTSGIKTGNIIRRHTKQGKEISCKGCAYRRRPQSTEKDTHEMRLYKLSVLNRCKSKGINCELSFEDYCKLIKMNCDYCGSSPKKKNYAAKNKYVKGLEIEANGIDRVDSSKTYSLGNCVPCCKSCNRAKSDLSREDFLEHIKRIYIHNELDND
jgi:hypothetical protein